MINSHHPVYYVLSVNQLFSLCTVFIRIKAGLKYTQGVKYMLGSAAEWKK